jgi:cell division protein FtsL
MDTNWLLQRLKSGEVYTIDDGINEPYQVNKPASSLSRKAAEIIEKLDQHIRSLSDTNLSLQAQINNLIQENEILRKANSSSGTC